jgi:uncharacterized protein YjbJ (UPF0337 family)
MTDRELKDIPRADPKLKEVQMNRDELDGKGEKIKGRAKQAWGDVTNDEKVREEGVADEAAGNVQEGYGRARRKVGETLDDIADEIKE